MLNINNNIITYISNNINTKAEKQHFHNISKMESFENCRTTSKNSLKRKGGAQRPSLWDKLIQLYKVGIPVYKLVYNL